MCKFCEMLHACFKSSRTMNIVVGMHDEYSAALVEQTFTDKEHEFRGELVHKGFRLRFCPECGANIKKRLRQWRIEAKE